MRNAKVSPWFAYVAFNSPKIPHTASRSTPTTNRDQGSPKSPAFDEADVTDKPKWVRQLPRISDQDRATYNRRGTAIG